MYSIFTKAGLTLALVGVCGLTTFAQTPAPQPGAPVAPARRERTGPRGDQFGPRGGHVGSHDGPHGFARHALRQLNLTDAQQQQVKAIHERYAADFQPQRQELHQLMEQRAQGTLSAEQQARVRELRTQLWDNADKLHAELRSVLTPEQRTQLQQAHEQLRQHREEFRQRREQRREQRRADRPDAPPIDQR